MAPTAPGPAKGSPPAPPSPPRRWLRRLRNLVILLPFVFAAGVALWIWAALAFSYSTGERAGYVQKFSKKGWLCKTWEGELAMVSLPGAMPEIFAFTVRDPAVAAEVNRQLGNRVTLTYAQHMGLPSCLGETQYFVDGVRRVQP